MLRPSGDQRGDVAALRLNEVNFRALDPSDSAIQLSILPDRSEAKAIRLPSGEKSGSTSARLDEARRVGSSDLPLAGSQFTDQMLISDNLRVYASRSSRRDIA